MIKKTQYVFLLFLLIFFLISNMLGSACKDIIVCNDATSGDYNLLLKIRDPSRPDLQILYKIPEGYEYWYHDPWNGEQLFFTVDHTFIGVTSLTDVPPNIIKPGMMLNDAGIAFGDADSGSDWVNPTRYAWDDFDWMRYACQYADDEDEAIDLLTSDVVDSLHASGVSENLFIVGPQKAFVVEADAVRYRVSEVEDFCVMSTYPKLLWRTQIRAKLPIALDFDEINTGCVKAGRVIRLGSLFGVGVLRVNETSVVVCQIPFLKLFGGLRFVGLPASIKVGESAVVGDYFVEVLDIVDAAAEIRVRYKYKAWEDKMRGYIEPFVGNISVLDMMNWSRFHEEELDGLRPMCEDGKRFESAAVFKIPTSLYENLSCIWFSANHPCSSIFVPVHMCDTDIFDSYTNGSAANLSLKLLDMFGHGFLSKVFSDVEEVLVYENELREELIRSGRGLGYDVSGFFTDVDMEMQYQAFLFERIWFDIALIENSSTQKFVIDIVDGLWSVNFSNTLLNMVDAVVQLEFVSGAEDIVDCLHLIMDSISEILLL